MLASLLLVTALFVNEPVTTEEPIDSVIECYGDYNANALITEYYVIEADEEEYEWTGAKLTKSAGKVSGPNGSETYYNLPMGKCIDIMRSNGYSVEEYPYWVREDGCKMLGEYVMVGANTYQYPKGTILPTTLGLGIVADHCVRAESEYLIDIAVTW